MLSAACDGDARAQEAIYRSYQRPVYSLIRRLIARPAIADELFQETFVEILRSMRSYSGEGAFGGWVRSDRGEQVPDVPALAVASQLRCISTPTRTSRSPTC